MASEFNLNSFLNEYQSYNNQKYHASERAIANME